MFEPKLVARGSVCIRGAATKVGRVEFLERTSDIVFCRATKTMIMTGYIPYAK